MTWKDLSDALADAVAAAGPSVVGVRAARHGPIAGVAWDEQHVLTVGRVGRGDETAVRLPDGTVREARVVGRARRLGLALLAVEGGGLTPVTWADTDGLRVGNLVVAIGRAHGEVHATLGMVSRVGGPWRTRWGGTVDRFLGVDGSLPAGGSGGVLLGPDGAALGLNTAGLVRGGTTLPSETVRRVVARLLRGGTRRAYLGTSFIPVDLPAEVADAEGRPRALLAVAIEPGGPSDQAGLKLGDALLALGDRTFDDLPALLAWLAEHPPGEEVEARLLRAGAETRLSVTPVARPD